MKPPHQLSGLSLLPQLNDVEVPGKEIEFTIGSPKGYGIRTESYRYTEWRKEINHADFSMLYGLEKDPDEFENLVGNPDYKELIQKLKEELNARLIRE